MRAVLFAPLLGLGCSESAIRNLPTDVPTTLAEGLGGISGQICAPDSNTWVAGAEVSIEHDEGVSSDITDGVGAFTLVDVPPGEHEVTAIKGSYSLAFTVTVVADQVTELPVPECIQQGSVKVAVVTGDFDSIEDIIADLGIDHDLIDGKGNGYRSFLTDPDRMAQYDSIFFNCGFGLGGGLPAATADNLAAYVRQGGNVYASDWAYEIVERTWPNKQRFLSESKGYYGVLVGNESVVDATVLDPVLAELIDGDTARIDYAVGGWAVVEQTNAEVLLEGRVTYSPGYYYKGNEVLNRAPLAHRFVDGEGTVIFTTFHNERQRTPDMTTILQDIVLSL
ncbi:MAG: carboxypeptidase-like regulatory domain-containing protein [Myxococcales bacterium]|nr:carboxypeptidase-like regulatory domain-containing protein [Myxococcales bacterium]